MPETPVTREQLLASVHELHDGDLLVVRAPTLTLEQFHDLSNRLAQNKPDGVRMMIVSDELSVEVVRPEMASDIAEAVARATANPGHVVEVQP